jgi:uncharacterized protein
VFIDLDQVPLEGQVVDRTIPIEDFSTKAEEFKLASSVVLMGTIQPIRDGISEAHSKPGAKPAKGSRPASDRSIFRLRGRMACRVELECVRCLAPVERLVEEELDLLYLPQSLNVPGEGAESLPERGLVPEELAVAFYRDGRVDLSQLILEQIVLALPMKFLCNDDCQGLCPSCGANRNVTSCECEPDEPDPRWAKLKTLLGP